MISHINKNKGNSNSVSHPILSLPVPFQSRPRSSHSHQTAWPWPSSHLPSLDPSLIPISPRLFQLSLLYGSHLPTPCSTSFEPWLQSRAELPHSVVAAADIYKPTSTIAENRLPTQAPRPSVSVQQSKLGSSPFPSSLAEAAPERRIPSGAGGVKTAPSS